MKLKLSRRHVKHVATAGFGMVATVVFLTVTVTFLLAGNSETSPDVVVLPTTLFAQPADGRTADSLKVMTLNLAHGRANGRNQLLQRSSTIRANLDLVSDVLMREGADVIAMQEADGHCFWSGRFSHGAYVGVKSQYRFLLPGRHVHGGQLEYGTALLSRRPLVDPLSIAFKPTPPTFSKGFVVSSAVWPGRPGYLVDVVSVHLDYSRSSNRKNQVDEMIRVLSERERPMIVMGDFNCEWKEEGTAVRKLAEAFDLKTLEDHETIAPTFPALSSRIDWILISSEFDFKSYRVLPDVLSDHQPIVAEIVLLN